jgi:hypothetical protein
MSHFSLFKVVRPEYPKGVSPLLLSEVSACDVSPSFPLLVFPRGVLSPTITTTHSLRQLVSSCSLIGFQSVQVLTIIVFVLFSFHSVTTLKVWQRLVNFLLFLRQSCHYALLPFRRDRHNHNVQCLIYRNPMDIPAACFSISSLKDFLSSPSDVLSIIRGSCRLVLQSLQSLFTSLRPFGALRPVLRLVLFSRRRSPCTMQFLHSGPSLAQANIFRDPQLPGADS